jgi:pyruvate/2-oxoglutarate dehydrogenase complex dihydrolipoamide acyltransferase (E2) component
VTDAAGGRNGTGRPIDRRAGATARRDALAAWRIACFTCPTVRVLVATILALALAAPAAAHAGRQLTRAEAAQVRGIVARVQAERQAKADRRRAASDKKKRVRAAKMAAALEMAADYKAEKARKAEKRDTARKREEARRNGARLRFIEQLLQERAARGR